VSEIPADVREAWQRAIARWDDTSTHEALLAATTRHGCFAWSAARYRERTDDPIAARQLERIKLAATATLLGGGRNRLERKPMPYRSSMIALALLVLMMVLGFIYAQVMDHVARPPAAHGVISR
jgi:hypothetical protein